MALKPPAHSRTDIFSVDRWAGWRCASTSGMPSITASLPTPEDVALDLAGHRLGEFFLEADDVRVLVALQPLLAAVLELGDERFPLVGGGEPGCRDDMRPDFHESLDLD